MDAGIDVFHDTFQRSKSVFCFLASTNPDFNSHFSTVKLQKKSGLDIAQGIESCLYEALNALYHVTKQNRL